MMVVSFCLASLVAFIIAGGLILSRNSRPPTGPTAEPIINIFLAFIQQVINLLT